jgi:hypothetical protein
MFTAPVSIPDAGSFQSLGRNSTSVSGMRASRSSVVPDCFAVLGSAFLNPVLVCHNDAGMSDPERIVSKLSSNAM